MRKCLFMAGIMLLALLIACAPEPATMGDEVPNVPPASPESPAPPVFTVPTFHLAELPPLDPYAPPGEIVKRYSDAEFVDTLQVANDYGRLYPFVGKLIGDENDIFATDQRYGLADSQGRIVVDPVYEYASYYYDNPDYLYLHYPMDRSDEQLMAKSKASYWVSQPRNFVFAKADGSWVSNTFLGDSAGLSEDRITVIDYSGDNDDYWEMRNMRYRLYDLEGNLLAEGDGYLMGFSEGLGLVRQGESSYFIDKQGNIAIPGPFVNAWYFEQGRAQISVLDEYENYMSAYIDREGNLVSEPAPPVYFDVPPGYTVTRQDDLYSLHNAAGREITPLLYNYISFSDAEQPTVALGRRQDDSQWLIELPGGAARKLESSTQAGMYGDDWCVAQYFGNVPTPFNPEGDLRRGLAFIRGDITHYVGFEDFVSLDYDYISGDVFALSYYSPEAYGYKRLRLDFYDAALGEVIKSFDGVSFTRNLENNLLMLRYGARSDYETNRYTALNPDFTPAFGGETFSSINHVADNVYSVRNALHSGLIRPNGEWLLRININNMD